MTNIGFDEGVQLLKPLLEKRKLIIFAGSGISVPPPSNLPTWDALLREFIVFCDNVQDTIPDLADSDRFDDLINDATNESSKYPIRVASALKQKLIEIDDKYQANVTKLLSTWLLDIVYNAQPNDNHDHIVGTDYPYILTTNYDRLLEIAAKNLGYKQLNAYSYTFKDAHKVGGAIFSGIPAILHLHGDPTNIVVDDFVFTTEDYARIKREYAGFALSLQSLMLSYSVLFVGYGGSDPHLEEMVEEIRYLFDYSNSSLLPESFLVLKAGKDSEVLHQYKKKMRTKIITLRDYEETPKFLKALRDIAPRPIA